MVQLLEEGCLCGAVVRDRGGGQARCVLEVRQGVSSRSGQVCPRGEARCVL